MAAIPSGGGFGKLTNLQVLRAVAAGSVVLSHASRLLLTDRGDRRFLDVFNDHLGSFGVALFFAISGFLMAQLARAHDPGTFLVHRALRIYPMFLLAVAIWFPVRRLGGVEVPLDPLALTLAPVGVRDYPLGIEWTLVYETSFYLLVFLVAAFGLARRLEWVAAGWIVLLAVMSATGSAAGVAEPFPRLDAVFLKAANVAFAVGLLLPWLIERGILPVRLCLLGLPAAALVIWGEAQPLGWVLAVPAALIVAGLVQMRQMAVRGLFGTGLVRFGDWSYVLYLVHLPVLTVSYRLAPPTIPALPLFIAGSGLTLVATGLLGPLDVAFYRRARRWADRARPRWRSLAAWIFAGLYLGIAGSVSVLHVRDVYEAAAARAALGRLPPASLRDGTALIAAIETAGLLAPQSFRGSVERTMRLPTGAVLVIGWAFDDAHPDAISHLALICAGRIATVARPQRYRPDVAATLGRPDLRWRRIGFTAALEPETCPTDASLLPVFVGREGVLLPASPVPLPSSRAG